MVKAHLLETRIPVQLSSVMYYQKSLVEKSIAPVLIYELSMHVHWVPSPKDGHHLIGTNSPWLTWTSYSCLWIGNNWLISYQAKKYAQPWTTEQQSWAMLWQQQVQCQAPRTSDKARTWS